MEKLRAALDDEVTRRESAERGKLDAESALQQSVWTLQGLVEQMVDGAVVSDSRGRVVTINHSAVEMLGGAAATLASDFALDERGQPLLRHPDGRPFEPKDFPWRRASTLGESARDVEMIVARGAGQEAHLIVSASPLRDASGALTGAVAVFRDVTEPRRLIAELLEANRRLEEFNRLKAEFVANMSHELRTPLTAIIGFAQLMQMNVGGGEPLPRKHSESLERILRNSRHLLSLIDDVLDLSKIEVGRIAVHPDYVDLVEVVEAAFAELQSLARQKGLEYLLSVRDEFPMAFTDALRVRQIVINLLSNALKFTVRGSVSAEMRRAGEGEWQLVVRDTGIGIKRDALGLIFERFRQVDGSTTRAAGGVGLGLTIVQQIVHLLGGSVEVASEYGVGSTFTVTLPLNASRAAHAAIESAAARAWEGRSVALSESAALSDVAGAAAAEGHAREATDAPPLVLVIEDDPDAASLLTETLTRSGYRVRVAESGDVGLAAAREDAPSVITLDIMMPNVDGWSVLRAIKADAATAQIPVVVCSIVDNRPLGYRLGAADYLVKPVSPQRLVESLRGVGATPDAGEGYVLVVDDEQGFRSLMRAGLENAGYAARAASSGETALRQIEQGIPRAVLCDLMMPGGMSGFELIARLRADSRTARIPIVVITARDVTPGDLKLVSGQIADVIRKGDLLLPDLEARLREVLEEIGVPPADGEDSSR